ncbi:transcriptional regulator [Bradyrhizobium cenepequi]
MAGRKPAEGSPESIARANRQRLALEEGARAMADVQQQAIAVRKNMERLRALREAKEAEEATAQAARPDISNKKRKKVLSK